MKQPILTGLALCLCLVPPVVAQSGRRTVLLAQALPGQTMACNYQYPPIAAGNFFTLLVSTPPFHQALPVYVPGYPVVGMIRVNPTSAFSVMTGILDSTGATPPWLLSIPSVPAAWGFEFDVQGADLSHTNLTIHFSEDDVNVVVGVNAALGMVPIQPGTFMMGSTQFGPSCEPVHAVTISRPFWMARYETTQAEYAAVMGSNPAYHQGPAYPMSSTMPIEWVSTSDAMAYCASLTAREASAGRLPPGYVYRLPTEAEWEYCCRAGTTGTWYFGSVATCASANVNNQCGYAPQPVGRYAPNPWGLYDMAGNIGELVLDRWDNLPNYAASAVLDPYNPQGSLPVYRGGSYYLFAVGAGYRYVHVLLGHPPDGPKFDIGFRVVLAPPIP